MFRRGSFPRLVRSCAAVVMLHAGCWPRIHNDRGRASGRVRRRRSAIRRSRDSWLRSSVRSSTRSIVVLSPQLASLGALQQCHGDPPEAKNKIEIADTEDRNSRSTPAQERSNRCRLQHVSDYSPSGIVGSKATDACDPSSRRALAVPSLRPVELAAAFHVPNAAFQVGDIRGLRQEAFDGDRMPEIRTARIQAEEHRKQLAQGGGPTLPQRFRRQRRRVRRVAGARRVA